MPIKTWADGNIPTASDLNTQYRDQVISTVTSGTRPAGTEGQVIYETDTDKFQAYTGAAFVEFGKLGASNAWTPTITQSTSVSFTTTYSGYYRIGQLIICWGAFAVTNSGLANNVVLVSTPVTSSPGGGTMLAGGAWIVDASVPNRYPALVNLNSTGAFRLVDATQATNNVYLGQTGAAFSVGLASGDTIGVSALFEAA